MTNQTVMNLAAFKKLLNEIGNEISDDYQAWMSSDEEGNEFLPMPENTEFCLAIDKDENRIIFFSIAQITITASKHHRSRMTPFFTAAAFSGRGFHLLAAALPKSDGH